MKNDFYGWGLFRKDVMRFFTPSHFLCLRRTSENCYINKDRQSPPKDHDVFYEQSHGILHET